ncbi:MAG: hypothetical protein M1299_08760 [Firmicutes bacterium]|nr:hypothetical protein [Bacillota bacterium]
MIWYIEDLYKFIGYLSHISLAPLENEHPCLVNDFDRTLATVIHECAV